MGSSIAAFLRTSPGPEQLPTDQTDSRRNTRGRPPPIRRNAPDGKSRRDARGRPASAQRSSADGNSRRNVRGRPLPTRRNAPDESAPWEACGLFGSFESMSVGPSLGLCPTTVGLSLGP